MPPQLFKLLIYFYPPYWGTGIAIESISADYTRMTVRMKSRFYNRNYVGTHFGGSLYAMTDPFYMLMLIQNLGNAYLVWDQSARIEFIKPGRGTVTAEFHINRTLIETIKTQTANGDKYLPELLVEVKDKTGQLVARVFKTLYVRKKR